MSKAYARTLSVEHFQQPDPPPDHRQRVFPWGGVLLFSLSVLLGVALNLSAVRAHCIAQPEGAAGSAKR